MGAFRSTGKLGVAHHHKGVICSGSDIAILVWVKYRANTQVCPYEFAPTSNVFYAKEKCYITLDERILFNVSD